MKKEDKILEKLTELFIDHPEQEYNLKDLQEYLKSEGFDIEEHELLGVLLDMLDMKIIEDIDYYKLNTDNPAIRCLLKREFENIKESLDELKSKEVRK